MASVSDIAKGFTISGLLDADARTRERFRVAEIPVAEIADHVPFEPGDRVIRAEGLYLSPGFVDIHVHGGGGFSAMSGKAEDVVAMANAHARFGTTSIVNASFVRETR